jgi:hypothetical protein
MGAGYGVKYTWRRELTRDGAQKLAGDGARVYLETVLGCTWRWRQLGGDGQSGLARSILETVKIDSGEHAGDGKMLI